MTNPFKIKGNVLVKYKNNGSASAIVPNYVMTIGTRAFEKCTALFSVMISDSVTTIGVYAFQSCTNLRKIRFSANLSRICSGAFSMCSSLVDAELPMSLSVIEQYAFMGCSNLVSVTLPVTLSGIGFNAFVNCPMLKEIVVTDGSRVMPFYIETQLDNNVWNNIRSMFYNQSNQNNQVNQHTEAELPENNSEPAPLPAAVCDDTAYEQYEEISGSYSPSAETEPEPVKPKHNIAKVRLVRKCCTFYQLNDEDMEFLKNK